MITKEQLEVDKEKHLKALAELNNQSDECLSKGFDTRHSMVKINDAIKQKQNLIEEIEACIILTKIQEESK